MKALKSIAGLLLVALAIYGAYSIGSKFKRSSSNEVVTSDVLLEKIEKVYKLITVEGNFSEIYNYQHHYFADIWPFRKKALVRVNARVLVGYDLESIEVSIDESSRTITISNFPEPEILSVEHDLDFYNFESGIFNLITNRDITDMSTRAKEFIEEKAMDSELFAQAEEQRAEMFELFD